MQETSSYNVRVTNFILRLSIWIKFGKRIIKCLPIGSLEADEGQSKICWSTTVHLHLDRSNDMCRHNLISAISS
jgi:hypothetical protein